MWSPLGAVTVLVVVLSSKAAYLPQQAVGTIETFIGSTQYPGKYVVNGSLMNCDGLAFDVFDNLLVADRVANIVYRVENNRTLSVVAGNGTSGFSGDGGSARAAKLWAPSDLSVSYTSITYIAEAGNHVIRMVFPDGTIGTLAGIAGSPGFSDGNATSALLNTPQALAVDSDGHVWIADTGNHAIRVVNITTLMLSTVAGAPPPTAAAGFAGDGGLASAARFSSPQGITVTDTKVYISDRDNNRVRVIYRHNNTIATFAGTGGTNIAVDVPGLPAVQAQFEKPVGIDFDYLDNVHFAAQFSQLVVKVFNSSWDIAINAGNGSIGFYDGHGWGPDAVLNFPTGLALDPYGHIYFCDSLNFIVRRIQGVPPTPTPTASPSATATSTPTPSATASATPTASMSPSATASASPSPTTSSTHTPSMSASPSMTATLSATTSASPTQTTTPTATPSPTASATATATATPSHTPSMSATLSPTASTTHTPTPTASATATPSATHTQTPSATASATATATPTRTQTPSPSTTPTQSQSVKISPLPNHFCVDFYPCSRTPTPSSSPSSTPTPSVTPTATASPSSTASGTPSSTATQTVTATSTVTISDSRTRTRTQSLTRTQTPSRTFEPTPLAIASRTSSGGNPNIIVPAVIIVVGVVLAALGGLYWRRFHQKRGGLMKQAHAGAQGGRDASAVSLDEAQAYAEEGRGRSPTKASRSTKNLLSHRSGPAYRTDTIDGSKEGPPDSNLATDASLSPKKPGTPLTGAGSGTERGKSAADRPLLSPKSPGTGRQGSARRGSSKSPERVPSALVPKTPKSPAAAAFTSSGRAASSRSRSGLPPVAAAAPSASSRLQDDDATEAMSLPGSVREGAGSGAAVTKTSGGLPSAVSARLPTAVAASASASGTPARVGSGSSRLGTAASAPAPDALPPPPSRGGPGGDREDAPKRKRKHRHRLPPGMTREQARQLYKEGKLKLEGRRGRAGSKGNPEEDSGSDSNGGESP